MTFLEHEVHFRNQSRNITGPKNTAVRRELTGMMLVFCNCGYDSGWVERDKWNAENNRQEFLAEHQNPSDWLTMEPSNELHTPLEWADITGTRVMDSDGWRYAFTVVDRGKQVYYGPRDWNNLITREEFTRRAGRSTLTDITTAFKAKKIGVVLCKHCGQPIAYWGGETGWSHALHPVTSDRDHTAEPNEE
jgi:hypothetical protein